MWAVRESPQDDLNVRFQMQILNTYTKCCQRGTYVTNKLECLSDNSKEVVALLRFPHYYLLNDTRALLPTLTYREKYTSPQSCWKVI